MVLDDVLLAWDYPDVKPHGLDVAVILGGRERKDWCTFDVAKEGVRPALIVELASPDTASLDRSNKLEAYDLAGVPLYVIVDALATRQEPRLRLLAYTQTPDGYPVPPPDERGWNWLEPVRTWLSIEHDEIVCRDTDGRPLGDSRALTQTIASAKRREEAINARVRELEQEIRRLHGLEGPP